MTATTAQAQLPSGYEHQIRGRTISVPSALPGFLFPSQTSISNRNVALNDDGDVAITVAALPSGGDTTQAIWAHRDGTGGIVHTGTITPAFAAGFGDVLLTSTGRLYWTESPDVRPPEVLYLDPAGTPTFVTSGPIGTIRYASLRVSEPDQLAVLAQLGTGRVLVGIDNIQTPSITIYLAESSADPSSPFTYLISSIGLNRTPELSIEAWPAGVETLQRVTAPNQTTQIAAVGDTIGGVTIRAIANGSAINAAGQVAFAIFGQDSIDAVLRAEPDGSITVIASTAPGSQIAELGNFPPVINDAGWVAFRGVGADGEDAIYVGDGIDLVTVVRETDVVSTDLGSAQIGNEVVGQPYTAFSGNIAINQRGDVAYVANVYPKGDRSVEWGTGVFVAVAGLPPQEPPDAGVPDAGSPDAGLPDAGLPDAAIADAAVADASVADASTPGLADAAPGEPPDASRDASGDDMLDAAPGDDTDASPPRDPGTPGGGCGCTAGQTGSGSRNLGMLVLALGVAAFLRRPRPSRSSRG